MFDFLFKKRLAPTTASPEAKPTPAKLALDAKQQGREAALARALSFSGQEAAALAFLLTSEFADARLQALQHIHDEASLHQVAQAMRNVDRRVQRQAQEKLATLKNHKLRQQATQQCLQRGQALLAQEVLLINELTDWDRQSSVLGEQASDLLLLRAELETKIQQQLSLQRQVMQLGDDMQTLYSEGLPSDELQTRLMLSRGVWIALQEASGFASVPKQQINRLAQVLAALQTLADRPVVDMPVITLELVVPAQTLDIPPEPALPSRQLRQQPDTGPEHEVILTALEQALEQGSLQQALDIDKTLRLRCLPERGPQAVHLQTLRAELTRLLDWARWGGHISRTELIKVAEELLQGNQAPADIGRQVGGLRSRWKELDRTSGPAGKLLWEQFDGACSRAYQIAEDYFRQQAQLRQLNLTAAQALLAEMDVMVAAPLEPAPDLSVLQSALQQKKSAWRHIGVVDRKHKNALQHEFDKKWAELCAPIDAAHTQAIAQRHALIAAVAQIDPRHRQAIDEVKEIQQRWQQESLTLRLEHRLEQALWQQFRSACDGLFAARKLQTDQYRHTQQQAAQDAQTHSEQLLRQAALLAQEKKAGLTNLRAKIALCRELEVAGLGADAGLVAGWAQQWQALSAGPILTVSLGRVLNERFAQALEKLSQGQSAYNGLLPDTLAQFEQSLLQLELHCNLPSPAGLAQQRLQLQISHLQTAMKQRDGVGAQHVNHHLQILCRSVLPLDALSEQRFQAILEDSPNFAGLV